MDEPAGRCQAPDCDATLKQPPSGFRARYCSPACRQRAARARAATLTEKRCAACHEVKPIADFYAPYSGYCRNCEQAKQRAYYAAGTSHGREYSYDKSLRRLYGITLDQYKVMATAQDGRCAICGDQPKGRLRVDHNHVTGVIRELLCNHCNVAIAQARENPDLLRAMITYLDRHKGKGSP